MVDVAGQAARSPAAEIDGIMPLFTQQRTMSRIERKPVTSAPSMTIGEMVAHQLGVEIAVLAGDHQDVALAIVTSLCGA